MMLDKRLNAYREDLADVSLRDKINAARFVAGEQAHSIAPVLALYREPSANSMQLSQVLFGEQLHVFETNEGWAWVKLDRDGYVGYVDSSHLSREFHAATHIVCVPSTFIYPAPTIKSQPPVRVYMNAELAVSRTEGDFAELLSGGFVYATHIAARSFCATDPVSVAEQFLHVPYLWGGKTADGLDCSGLVQTALHACGREALRDSDMQEETLGATLMINDIDGLQRGDLVFWAGHVGIMADRETLIHANGYHMRVVQEPLRVAMERIAATGSSVTSFRRI
jgi:cell wall-associated NlpC family hydrolase